MGYSRHAWVMTLISASVLMSGCMGGSRKTQIGPYPISFPGTYEKDYTIDAQAAVQFDDSKRIGTMIQTTHEGIRDEKARKSHLKSVTYPGYTLSKAKSITSDCEISYIRYHASLISDPITEQKLYLSYVFLPDMSQDQTITVSYLTPDKARRSTRDDARKESLGCVSDN